ncbi:MAG: hypothetical protein AAFN38_13685 [Cyanobacteria bacterium J06560_5]
MPETDAIFKNIAQKDTQAKTQLAKRISLDCKATVKLGHLSRGGLTRGHRQADDHDMGVLETYVPCGVVDKDNSELFISFGSSYKTSVFKNAIPICPNGTFSFDLLKR